MLLLKNGGRKSYGVVSNMVRDLKGVCPWINRHVIDFAYKKFIKNQAKPITPPVLEGDGSDVPDTSTGTRPRGRPTGTTFADKMSHKYNLARAHDAAAIEYHREKITALKKGKYVERGCLKKIIEKQKAKFGLEADVKIDPEAIRSRYYRGHLSISSYGPKTPMSTVEPKLVELIIRMSRIRRCLTGSQCLHLANDLIAGTDVEKEVIKFKEKIYKKKFETASLGMNYWRGFKKRWEHRLTCKRGQKFALDRSCAATLGNFAKMYDEVYDAMVECGVASVLPEPVYMNRDGDDTTTNIKEAFGLPCTHKIIHPDMCLVVDEVGSNLSQKGDGHVGGRKVMCEKHCTPQEQVQHKEKHFTLLGFTALSGEPVLCLIIIAGVREELSVETGIDPIAITTGDVTINDFLTRILVRANYIPMDPFVYLKAKRFNGW